MLRDQVILDMPRFVLVPPLQIWWVGQIRHEPVCSVLAGQQLHRDGSVPGNMKGFESKA